MVMLFNILLLDDTVCLLESQDCQRRRLWAMFQCIAGQVEIGERCERAKMKMRQRKQT